MDRNSYKNTIKLSTDLKLKFNNFNWNNLKIILNYKFKANNFLNCLLLKRNKIFLILSFQIIILIIKYLILNKIIFDFK